MSRVRLRWTASLPAACLAVVMGAVWSQERLETGLQLRMTDRLEAISPGASREPPRRDDPAVDTTPSSGSPVRGLSLQVTSGLRFDDNIYRTDTDERRDTIVVVEPSVYADGRFGRHDVRLGYEGAMERYQQVASENFFNHRFLATTDLDFTRILKSSLYADIEFATDPRGDLTTRPLDLQSSEPDRWRKHRLGGSVTLGRRIARAQFGLAYGVEGVRYLNNNQSDRDFDQRDLVLTGRYNLGPRYALLAELGGSWVDYLSPVSTQDARDYEALVGLAWEATAKTRGEVKVGLRHRDFHDLSRSSIGGYTWDARVYWAPKTYNQFTAYTSREVTEGGFRSDGSTGTAVVDVVGLRWRYGLSERLTFDSGIERAVSAFVDGGDDEFMSYDAGLRYKLNRWVDAFGEWTLDTRSGSDGGFEASGVFIGFDMRLDRPLGR